MSTYNLEKIMLVALTVRELTFGSTKPGGLHEKRTVATGNLGTVSAFAAHEVNLNNI
jgi:hypothetical protein